MKLEHEVVNLNSFYNNLEQFSEHQNSDCEQSTEKLILLSEGNSKEESVVAQSISLDIRGNFGDFLNKKVSDEYIWRGNQFAIEVRKDRVIITNILIEDSTDVSIDLEEWIEALSDWKEFYLKELGFRESKRADVSHLFGVLIMVYDKLSSPKDVTSEIIVESIKDCSKRYGVTIQTIRKQCKEVIGAHHMWEFYEWVYDIFNSITNRHTEILKRKEIDIQKAAKQYFNISI